MISLGLPLLTMQFQQSLDTVSTYLGGLIILWTGIFAFFTPAAASVWGKRLMFVTPAITLLGLKARGFFAKVRYKQHSTLLSTTLLLCQCQYVPLMQSFPHFVAMRIMQGFASEPFRDTRHLHRPGYLLCTVFHDRCGECWVEADDYPDVYLW